MASGERQAIAARTGNKRGWDRKMIQKGERQDKWYWSLFLKGRTRGNNMLRQRGTKLLVSNRIKEKRSLGSYLALCYGSRAALTQAIVILCSKVFRWSESSDPGNTALLQSFIAVLQYHLYKILNINNYLTTLWVAAYYYKIILLEYRIPFFENSLSYIAGCSSEDYKQNEYLMPI